MDKIYVTDDIAVERKIVTCPSCEHEAHLSNFLQSVSDTDPTMVYRYYTIDCYSCGHYEFNWGYK